MLGGIVGAAVEGHAPGCAKGPPQFVLAVFVRQIQLGIDGVGPFAALGAVQQITVVGLGVTTGDSPIVEAGWYTDPALPPAF